MFIASYSRSQLKYYGPRTSHPSSRFRSLVKALVKAATLAMGARRCTDVGVHGEGTGLSTNPCAAAH